MPEATDTTLWPDTPMVYATAPGVGLTTAPALDEDPPADANPIEAEHEPEVADAAPDRRRYWYDLEFHEDGKTIDLISIGIVADDGRTYYAVNASADIDRAKQHPWLVANVLPHLPMNNRGCLDRVAAGGRPPSSIELEAVDLDRTRDEVKPEHMIADEVRDFLTEGLDDGERCELWADYGAYDHVGLAQLWGPMIALPAGIPMYTRDIQQYADHLHIPHTELPDTPDEGEHHALRDAYNVSARWQYLTVADHAQRARRTAYPTAMREVTRTAEDLVDALNTGEITVAVTDSTQFEELRSALAYLDEHRQETTTDGHQ